VSQKDIYLRNISNF